MLSVPLTVKVTFTDYLTGETFRVQQSSSPSSIENSLFRPVELDVELRAAKNSSLLGTVAMTFSGTM